MWDNLQIEKYVKDCTPKKRFNHVKGVVSAAIALADKYGGDSNKAVVAALIHDAAKYLEDNELVEHSLRIGYIPNKVELSRPQLLHGAAAASIGRDVMGIDDQDILNAVKYHTTGRENMSVLEKIIYLADYIEPNREFPMVEDLRKMAFSNLNKAMIMAFDNTIKFVLEKKELIHINTIEARNYLLENNKKSK